MWKRVAECNSPLPQNNGRASEVGCDFMASSVPGPMTPPATPPRLSDSEDMSQQLHQQMTENEQVQHEGCQELLSQHVCEMWNPHLDDSQDSLFFHDDHQLQRQLKAAFGETDIGMGDTVGGVWHGPIVPVVPARKRFKVSDGDYRMTPSPEGSDSRISTATSTPVLTSFRSPTLSPQPYSPRGLARTSGKDYSQMSVAELREQLLGPNSEQEEPDIAVGWEKSELIAVLEEMDRICMPAMQALRL